MTAAIKIGVVTLAVACSITACHQTPQTTASVEQQLAVEPEVERMPTPAPERSSTRAELDRGVAHEAGVTEVVLDPRAEAALTLDADGGVRLWPRLHDASPSSAAASEPYRIPVHEPLWLTIAKRGQGFTLGFIATNNAGAVYRVELPHAGPPTITESFALSPEDPLLELHVLDGGERILALGVDHRVRLYAADGTLISELDERGFGPWQLRVSGGVGEPPKLAAVLAQPLRVQAIALVDDRLELVGQPRGVELDRGPNRNDLALSPDGKTVAALRRPHKHDPQWSVELIDLETDERKLIAGRVDTKVRPRMHFFADDRLLLESGSGQAWRVDLGLAQKPRRAVDLHPDSDFAKRLARRLEHEVVALPASAEHSLATPDDDQGLRMHASVVNGVRAGINARAGLQLVVGAVDQPTQLGFAHRKPSLVDAALDASGSTVVWASKTALHVERVGDPDSLVTHEHELGPVFAVAMSQPGRALIFNRKKASEIDLGSGELLASVDLPVGLAYEINTRISGTQLGYLSFDVDAPIGLLDFGGGLSARVASDAELELWGDLRGVDGTSTQALCVAAGASCLGGDRFARGHQGRAIYADSRRVYLFTDAERFHEKDGWTGVDVPGEWMSALTPSPTDPLVAVAKRRTHNADTTLISMVDTRTGELVSTTAVALTVVDQLRWSADGKRLAVVGNGVGQVLDVSSGERLHERITLGLEVTTITDAL